MYTFIWYFFAPAYTRQFGRFTGRLIEFPYLYSRKK